MFFTFFGQFSNSLYKTVLQVVANFYVIFSYTRGIERHYGFNRLTISTFVFEYIPFLGKFCPGVHIVPGAKFSTYTSTNCDVIKKNKEFGNFEYRFVFRIYWGISGPNFSLLALCYQKLWRGGNFCPPRFCQNPK